MQETKPFESYPSTDFAVHTRGKCATCVNTECSCVKCKSMLSLCGGARKFPMRGGCKWNTILMCEEYTTDVVAKPDDKQYIDPQLAHAIDMLLG